MSDSIKPVVFDKKEIDVLLQRLKENNTKTLTDIPVLWQRIVIYLYKITADTFDKQGARDEHARWKSLKETTLIARWRKRNKNKSFYIYNKKELSENQSFLKGQEGKVFVEKGKKGFKSHAQRTRAGVLNFMSTAKILQDTGIGRMSIGVLFNSKTELHFGTKNYMGVHQSPIKSPVPKREYLFLTKNDIEKIHLIVNNFLFETMDFDNL